MDLINLTPHDVNLLDDNGNCYWVIPPAGLPARCAEDYTAGPDLPCIVDVPTGYLSYNTVYDLPEPYIDQESGRLLAYYIVSVLVAQQRLDRYDLLVPYDIVRKNGQIVGCKKLVRLV